VKKILLILFSVCFFAAADVSAQAGRDEALAKSYFENGEFEKAADLYFGLWEKNAQSHTFYRELVKSYFELNKNEEAQKVIEKQIKKFKDNPIYTIDLGVVLKRKGEAENAKRQFEKAIKETRSIENDIRIIAKYFKDNREVDYEIATYEKGSKILGSRIDFTTELAAAYLSKGDFQKSANYYLNYIELNPFATQNVKNTLQSITNGDKLQAELETQLYTRIQKNPDNEIFIDLLTWIYVQKKDFESALLQMKALDKRKKEDGNRVLNIARMAQAEDYFDDAIAGYEYVTNKQPRTYLYFEARTEQLKCRKEKISKTLNYSTKDLLALKSDYLNFILENGSGPQTAQSIKELADLEGFYLYDIPSAISRIEELIALPGINQKLRNQAKLSLGDFYLINGEVWEATLLYSQVDKQEKDSPLGEEARFKNAKLSYYKGDFDWAQEQLNILKAATSEMISNDAINLSVFIIDNLGMDTISVPMELFARADLLSFQNKDDAANSLMDSIIFTYPGHELYDDILFAKAQILCRKKEFAKAVPLLENIIQGYGKDLKADDAIFLLADINDRELNNKEKAKELYQKLITEYQNSLLVLEARKKFRLLRGDKID
jgi:predicted Zn-dependent protease